MNIVIRLGYRGEEQAFVPNRLVANDPRPVRQKMTVVFSGFDKGSQRHIKWKLVSSDF